MPLSLSGPALSSAPPPSLLTLPTELQLEIISYLAFPGSFHLGQTCMYFHALIPTPDLPALLIAEQFDGARELNIFVCPVCMRLRGPGKFADNFRKGPWGRDGNKRQLRFCIECSTRPPEGVDPKLRYKKGESWTRFGMVYVKCKACLMVKRGAKERMHCEVCAACWERGKGRK
ncbi:hypothetical protein AOQ84DRAFT_191929 [Glonium stellatum]|uniref:F-box domain-containing protein n=1 Tax=Glonium stellatum TaxID=574774 RepID=A0A8E2F698_9PEZI|nr:hypothetical protein AOQ84DRAFT_191929 [Glonium stellatum]